MATLAHWFGKTLSIIVCLALVGCVLSPTDEAAVCGTNGAVSFSGFTLNPTETVQLEYGPSATGPFTPFATATTSASSVTVGRTALYSWSISTPVPGWRTTTAGFEVYLRARLTTGGNLVTFDTVNASGQTATTCLAEQLNAGRTAVEAATQCRSPDSPVIHVTAPTHSTCACPATYDGDVRIDGPASAAQFSCLRNINGSLTVTAAAPSAVSMISLTAVTGDVDLDYTTAAGSSRTINLSALDDIDGSLDVRGSFGAGPIVLGLDALRWLSGDLTVQLENTSTNALSVTGLSALSVIPTWANVRLVSRGAFTSSGFLPSFLSTETVHIESLGLDPTRGIPLTLPKLRLAIDLELVYPVGLPATPNTTGYVSREVLPELETASSIRITNDPYYPSYSRYYSGAPRKMPKLRTASQIVLEGTQLANLDFGASTISLQALTLRRNTALRELARPGLTFTSPTGPLTIVDNPALRQCDAQAFAVGYSGTVTISGNHPAGCGPCVPTAFTGDVVIDSPTAATTYRCVGSISGSLTVTDHPRTLAVDFPSLTSIGGNANLSYTLGDYRSHGDKRSITLPALATVGGNLAMVANFSELGEGGLDVGMPNVTNVGGNIELFASYGSLRGLSGLSSHAGNIYVHGPNLDTQGSLLLNHLTRADGTVRVEGFYQFTSFFPQLTSIGGALEIVDVRLNGGFPLLTRVDGDLVLRPKLLSPLTNLAQIGGTLRWENMLLASSLPTISGVPLTTRGLSIQSNPNLTTLPTGISVRGTGPITIQNNPMLPTCAALNYVSAQTAAGWLGTATIVGNGTGSCP
ncbi:MAG: hypothetical protein QM784_14990 [Polyangiaceae bacterium]